MTSSVPHSRSPAAVPAPAGAARRLKIVYLAAGAGGMVCGSCLHDNTLATALLAGGDEVLLVPTYTPLRTDELNVSQSRLFFGGINVYLQQQLALFRHTPWFLDRLLDQPRLVSWLASRAGSTRAEDLGPLTVSMLAGEHGHQRKELEKLLDWLEHEARPEVVHLSNAMLSAWAGPITRRLGVPVLGTLSGEDIFLEKLPEPWYGQCRELLRQHAGKLAGWVALNGYYADLMAGYLAVPRERIEVIPHGLNLAGYGLRRAEAAGPPRSIGYLARICPEKGLHLLVESFLRLAERSDLPPFRLEVAGYLGEADRPYLEELQRRIAERGLSDRYRYHGELSHDQKLRFFERLYLMCVPTVYRESKGISILEALASGVPMVLPHHGAFPEIVADTRGGLTYPADQPQALDQSLVELLCDPARAEQLGQQGRQAIWARYTAEHMARQTRALYQRVLRP